MVISRPTDSVSTRSPGAPANTGLLRQAGTARGRGGSAGKGPRWARQADVEEAAGRTRGGADGGRRGRGWGTASSGIVISGPGAGADAGMKRFRGNVRGNRRHDAEETADARD